MAGYPPQQYPPQQYRAPAAAPYGQPGYAPQPAPAYPPQQYGAPAYGAPQPVYGAPQPVYGQPAPYPTQPAQTVVGATSQPAGPSTELKKARDILESELFGCFDDCGTCLFACLCPCLISGNTMALANGSWCYGCLCVGYCAGCQRSYIQQTVGVPDAGCLVNCLTRLCCPVCSLTQEARAVAMWDMDRKKVGPGASGMTSH